MRSRHPYSDEPQLGISLRQVVELIVCLIVTVMCVRTFVVEGYMISTGSMAPGLLGYHKRVVCPRCQTPFELGVAFDAEEGFVSVNPDGPTHCRCPNCGEEGIDVTSVPKTQGDQLLVLKNAFAVRDPDRWEVVVFRNPALATEAYVKRVVGRPNESVRVIDGDVFIDHERARKNLAQCRATQITVYNDSRRAMDSDWQSRWSVGKAWEQLESGFISAETEEWSWIHYRHWLRSGGNHETAATVPQKQLAAAKRKFSIGDGLPFVANDLVEFDEQASALTVRGVMSDKLRSQLQSTSSDNVFRLAIDDLSARSHLAPVQDTYGYNTTQRSQIVNDLGIELTLSSDRRVGEFAVRLATPNGTFEVGLNLETGSAQLVGHKDDRTLRTGSFAPSALSAGVRIGIRHADRQVLVTFNDTQLFEPLSLPDGSGQPLDYQPVAFAARAADVSVDSIRIIRDIHYTDGRARNGIDEEFVLGDEEYFVLGDNSPVSSDSRNWANAAIHRSNLIGKPILVHLPSSPKALRFGSDNYLIRLPEFSRIRYIR